MPEGPEVRKHAVALDAALRGERIIGLTARTKQAKRWLMEYSNTVIGKRIERVRSHGKHLIGWVEGDVYFHSHLMMWGRWQVLPNTEPIAMDRRERARITTQSTIAILSSAPVFEIGTGEPYEQVEYLASLGPDSLPYHEDGPFDADEFLRRLLATTNLERTIGAALLDQQVVAGLGNYLRAEILFDCRLDPWRRISDLTPENISCLCRAIPNLCALAYQTSATVPEAIRARMREDASLVYQPGRDYGTRHYVFRRTNLPCLECGGAVRQLRQITREDEEGERTRIMYFCPTCQDTSIDLKPVKRKRPQVSQSETRSTS